MMPKNQIRGNVEEHSRPWQGKSSVSCSVGVIAGYDQKEKQSQRAGAWPVSQTPSSQRLWARDPGPCREGLGIKTLFSAEPFAN